jgi:predicted DsbA family dithiol-disulfide isomerase
MLFRHLFPLLSLVFISACSEAPDDHAHSHSEEKYTTLSTPIAMENTPDVMEIFSLTCGHCRSMEKELPKIEAASNQKITQSHATFNENASFAAFIFYTAMIQTDNNPPKALIDDLFKYVQEEQTDSPEMNKSILLNIFHKYGLISPTNLNESQKEALFTAMEKANDITRMSEITSVPSFVVKGKYVINTAAHKSATDIANTINELMNKK